MIDPLMSAEVVLQPESVQADRKAYDQLKDFWRGKGFTVGPESKVSFSISAKGSVFERLFGKVGTGEQQLPLNAIPPNLRRVVQGVYFTKAPDFGPTSF